MELVDLVIVRLTRHLLRFFGMRVGMIITVLLISLLVVPGVLAATGDISTVAGGARGSSGDGGPATNAKLDFAGGVAVDSAGNIYISDLNNDAIRKVDATAGIISTVAGTLGSQGYSGDGGLATSAKLHGPGDVAVDSAGNIFITDKSNSAIRKVDAVTGIINTIAGGSRGSSGDGGPATNAKLDNPGGVALDSSGNIFIADQSNHVVRKVDASTGIISTVAGTLDSPGASGDGGPATSAKLTNPSHVVVDAEGNIFISDHTNATIRKVDAATGNISTVAGTFMVGRFVRRWRPCNKRAYKCHEWFSRRLSW